MRIQQETTLDVRDQQVGSGDDNGEVQRRPTVKLLTNKNIDEVQMPENLALAMKVIMFRMKCAEIGCTYDYAHFAFGGSPFPVPDGVQEALKQHSGAGEYLPPVGIEPLRRQISKF